MNRIVDKLGTTDPQHCSSVNWFMDLNTWNSIHPHTFTDHIHVHIFCVIIVF